MPTKFQKQAGMSLSLLGKIRLGVKVVGKDGVEHPEERPYFVLKDAPEVAAVYGDQPTEILIYLPFPHLDQNLDVWHKAYKSWGCFCMGDGDKIIMLKSENGMETLVKNGVTADGEILLCPGLEYQPGVNGYPRCADCSAPMRLKMFVRDPHTDKAIGGFGYYQLTSRSVKNTINLTGQLEYVASIAPGGSLQGIPMKLKRVQRENTYPDEKANQRKKGKKWFIDLEFDLDWVERAQERVKQLAMGEVVTPLLDGGYPTEEHDGWYAIPKVIDENGKAVEVEAKMGPIDEAYNHDEQDGRLFDLAAMRDNLPGNWKDFHTVIGQAWGDGYDAPTFMKLVGEQNGRTKQTLDQETWNLAIDLLIGRVKGQV